MNEHEGFAISQPPQKISNVKPALNRAQILDATDQLLRETGYDATTIRRIAAELDCAVGTIYRYFTDKRELLGLVTQRVLEPVAQLLEAGGAFEASVQLYHQRASQHAQMYALMFWLSSQHHATEFAVPRQSLEVGQKLTVKRQDHPQLPPVVQRIIDAWTQRLGSESARQCWLILHGSIAAGVQAPQTLELMQRVMRPLGPTAAPTGSSLAQPIVNVTRHEMPETVASHAVASGV